MTDVDPFDSALGQRLRAIREELGLTADAVAANARVFGLTWRRTTVTAIEGGRRSVKAPELLLLPMILVAPRARSRPKGKVDRVSLSEILDFDSTVAKDVVLTRTATRKLLRGEVPTNRDVRWPVNEAVIKEMYDASSWRVIRDWWPEIDDPILNADRYAAVEAAAERESELKLAERLGVEPLVLAAASFRHWGKSLSDERDQRTQEQVGETVSTESRQAVRGRVSRQLLDEISIEIEQQVGGDAHGTGN